MSDETFNALQLILQCLGLVVGVVLFVAAVWRDDFKARRVKPELKLVPEDIPKGERTTVYQRGSGFRRRESYRRSEEEESESTDAPDDRDSRDESHDGSSSRSDGTPAFYWHLKLVNERPWVVAKNVELRLLKLSVREGSERTSERPLSGSLPMIQKGGEHIADVGYKSINCGLVRLVAGCGLQLRIAGRIPNNLRPRLYDPGSMELVLQAQGDNAVSNTLIVQIDWDGGFPDWDDGADCVRFNVREVYDGSWI